MTRPIRVEFPGALYHVMSRGVSGMAAFLDDADRQAFLGMLRRIVLDGLLIVHAFCLMTNHFHLLCETPLGKLSRCMQQLLSRYSRLFNSRHDREGHLWQSRYKAILVEDGSYFADCSAYIHLNPVKAGLVQIPDEYCWSSYRSYSDSDQYHDWVSVEKTIRYFGDIAAYRCFIDSKIGDELSDPFKKAVAHIAYGSDTFVRTIKARIKQAGRNNEVDGLRWLLAPCPLDTEVLGNLVSDVFHRSSPCQRRRALTYALYRFSGLSGRTVAALTNRTPQSVTAIWQSIEAKRTKDLQTGVAVRALEDAVMAHFSPRQGMRTAAP